MDRSTGDAGLKRFAYGCTGLPDAINFQLAFWRDSVATFKHIRRKWERCAIDGNNYPDGYNEYTEHHFIVDAVKGIVHAGTSLSILVGQNVPPQGANQSKTPGLRDALRELQVSIDSREKEFIRVYDAIRHFGEAQHTVIFDLFCVRKYCELMRTAQSLWKQVLQKRNLDEQGNFDNDFRLD